MSREFAPLPMLGFFAARAVPVTLETGLDQLQSQHSVYVLVQRTVVHYYYLLSFNRKKSWFY